MAVEICVPSSFLTISTAGSGGTLTLSDLTITNGVENDGGAILNQGTLNVQRCTFTVNHASNSGGAVYLDNSAGAHPAGILSIAPSQAIPRSVSAASMPEVRLLCEV